MKRKIISIETKNSLGDRCSNNPTKFAVGCRGYVCPMWKINDGFFDESGKQVDHIVELCHGGTNDISNLQVLCPSCHSVKTRRAQTQKWGFNSFEIDQGCSYMDKDKPFKKRRNSN